MAGPTYPSPAALRPRRGSEGPVRPIASALNLGNAHVDTIDQSHERCAALGLSPTTRRWAAAT